MPRVRLSTDAELKKNRRLWRYMDLSKFISLIDKQALWLARADSFKDKHEGRFPDDMREMTERAYKGFDKNDKSPVRDSDDFQDYLLKNTFLSCWHKNFDENMVMWEIYGRDNNAVAIQTTVGKLQASIDSSKLSGYSLKLGNVTYQAADKMRGELRYEDCAFRKRPHFAFEKEVRIGLDTYLPSNPSKQTPPGHILPVDINALIERILVHPDSPDWFLEVVRSIAKRYKVDAPVSLGLYGVR